MRKRTDLTGKRFGRLTVIEYVGKDKHGLLTWLCKCDCGDTSKVRTGDLLSGSAKSCGCLKREMVIEKNRKRAIAELDTAQRLEGNAQ